MRLPPSALALLLAFACAAAAASAQNSNDKGGVVYRWVDEHGVVHYGDTVPPQYARDKREMLNNEGVVVGHVDAEKTPAQLAAQERERARLSAQKQRDYFLLST